MINKESITIKPKTFRGIIAFILFNLAKKISPEDKFVDNYLTTGMMKIIDKIMADVIKKATVHMPPIGKKSTN